MRGDVGGGTDEAPTREREAKDVDVGGCNGNYQW